MKTSTTVMAAFVVLAGIASTDAAFAQHGMPKQTTGMRTHQTPTTMTPMTRNGPAMTGQPKQSCGSASAPNTPGNAANAPGSAFNPNGNAGSHYAGTQPQNSRNTASVSQYDAACSHQP